MIKNLLEYQEKDKERLTLVASIEGGRYKREIDAANRAINEAKSTLLTLENDAKQLAASYQSVERNLKEVFGQIEKYNKAAAGYKKEDEIQGAVKNVSELLAKISNYEGQLDDIAKRITTKTAAFEEAKSAVVRAQKNVVALTPGYDAALKAVAPKFIAPPTRPTFSGATSIVGMAQ